MRRSFLLLLTGALAAACTSAVGQPPPSLSPAREKVTPTPQGTVDLPSAPAEMSRVLLTRGRLVQGGLSFWRTTPGSEVFLDGQPVPTDNEGHFVLGFDRDHDADAALRVVFPGGGEERRELTIGDREFDIQRIDGLPPSKVTPYTEEQLAQIRRESKMKKDARSERTTSSYWRAGFDWPARGRISGVYGSQRILNGEPKRFHSGTDIAAPPGTTPTQFEGTPVRAPSTGRVTLAEEDFYFEGGLILIDHGQGLESALLHLSRVDVRPGQVVTKGEVVGAVGMTGRATGPHLHWAVKWQGDPMDASLLVPPMVSLGN